MRQRQFVVGLGGHRFGLSVPPGSRDGHDRRSRGRNPQRGLGRHRGRQRSDPLSGKVVPRHCRFGHPDGRPLPQA
eukprot:266704-Pyramimonas_sp.AAC.1